MADPFKVEKHFVDPDDRIEIHVTCARPYKLQSAYSRISDGPGPLLKLEYVDGAEAPTHDIIDTGLKTGSVILVDLNVEVAITYPGGEDKDTVVIFASGGGGAAMGETFQPTLVRRDPG